MLCTESSCAHLFSLSASCRVQVLKYETEAQPGTLGASVFGYNDAYAALQPLLRLRRAQQRRGAGDTPHAVLRRPAAPQQTFWELAVETPAVKRICGPMGNQRKLKHQKQHLIK